MKRYKLSGIFVSVLLMFSIFTLLSISEVNAEEVISVNAIGYQNTIIVEIKNERISKFFWATSGMMAPFYELLKVLTDWLVKRGVKRNEAQKYITSLFAALSIDSVNNSIKHLKYLVADSQTPRGLNEQAVKELRRVGFYKSLEKSLNNILKRLK